MEELLKSLIDIQQRLTVEKSQFNNFGKFHYRSLEDIEAAIKPLLMEHKCGIRFEDEIVEHCGRTFLKTTLHFFNTKGESISTTAEAEHSAQKTGMDASQISGAASSYARKYAMNAMFAIDDTKDADSDQFQASKKASPKGSSKLDKYDVISQALNAVTNQQQLMQLYYEHEGQVKADPQIRAMFTLRKQQINAA